MTFDPLVLSLSAFFFSSRRRHTRWPRDWSSDVCSSDLVEVPRLALYHRQARIRIDAIGLHASDGVRSAIANKNVSIFTFGRSEERRVGKECRSRRSADH